MSNLYTKAKTNKKIKVSIIVPVYNVAQYLKKCMDSIVGQTLKEIEIICINDGCTDNSLKILESYAKLDSRIKIISQENRGLGEARNSGLKIANGEYIGFVDSDDWLDLNYYAILYKEAKKQDADIARTNYKYNYPNEIKIEEIMHNIIKEKIYNNSDLGVNDHTVVVWNAIYKKEFLDKNNICYFDDALFGVEDVPFTARVTYFSSKSIPVAGTFYNYRSERENQLSLITSRKIECVIKANKITATFLNSHEVKNREDYLVAYKRLIWRFDYIFKKALELQEFNKEKQENYVKDYIDIFNKCTFLDELIEKYGESYFIHLVNKDVEGYIQETKMNLGNKKETINFYDENFYRVHAKNSYNSAKIIIDIFSQYYNPKTILDVGCGVGTWLKAWLENGAEKIKGLDINNIDEKHLYIKRKDIEIVNLENYILPDGKKFDLSMSLECAEHIRQESSRSFIKILTQSSDIVLFSAAIPHQSGTNHINCQPLSYWVALFKEQGYECFDFIRPALFQIEDNIDCWYLQNILTFAKGEKADNLKSQGLKPIKKPVMFYHEVFVNKIIAASTNNISQNQIIRKGKNVEKIKKICRLLRYI